MRNGEDLQRGVPERGKSSTSTTQTHSHTCRKHKQGYTHTNARCIIYPFGTAPGIQLRHPPGGVWQSHAKWILQRKRFKAFIALSVFQAAAPQGFDGLFSGSFLDFLRDFVVMTLLCISAAKGFFVSCMYVLKGQSLSNTEIWSFKITSLSLLTFQDVCEVKLILSVKHTLITTVRSSALI